MYVLTLLDMILALHHLEKASSIMKHFTKVAIAYRKEVSGLK
jgi:hypothetical protein